MISQKDPKSKGIEGAFMEKSEMRKLAEFIEKLSWDDLPEEVKTTVSFRVLDLISAALGAVDDPLVKKVKASYLERNTEQAVRSGEAKEKRIFLQLLI